MKTTYMLTVLLLGFITNSYGTTGILKIQTFMAEDEETFLEKKYNVSISFDKTRRFGLVEGRLDSMNNIIKNERRLNIVVNEIGELFEIPTLYKVEPKYYEVLGKHPRRVFDKSLFLSGGASIENVNTVEIKGHELVIQTKSYSRGEYTVNLLFSTEVTDYFYAKIVKGKVDSIYDSLYRHTDAVIVIKTANGGVHIFEMPGLFRDFNPHDKYYKEVIEGVMGVK